MSLLFIIIAGFINGLISTHFLGSFTPHWWLYTIVSSVIIVGIANILGEGE